jgi:hypothetical protein
LQAKGIDPDRLWTIYPSPQSKAIDNKLVEEI